MGKIIEDRRRLRCTQEPRHESSVKPLLLFFSSSRNVPGYVISRTLTQILVVTFPSAYHLRNTRGYTSFWHTTHATYADFLPRTPAFRFTLCDRCISCYFCSQCPTSVAESTDVKGIFKSICDIRFSC